MLVVQRSATPFEKQEYGWDHVFATVTGKKGPCDICGKRRELVFSVEYDRHECMVCFETKEGRD